MKTDIINVGLMIASVALAILLPFELFLLSYAVLGPLHYATEISWLQKKQYFVTRKIDWMALVIVCSVITILMILVSYWPNFKDSRWVESFLNSRSLDKQTFGDELSLWPACLIFLALTSAFILTFVKDWFWRINSFAAAIFCVLLFKGTPNYTIFFGILLTTIIHVWLFTGIFMLSGAIKAKNISSYLSFAAFLGCSASFIFISRENYAISNKALEIVSNSGFGLALNQAILQMFSITFEKADLLSSSTALKVQSFIAFAYTYHYLNWFSKVEVIKWNKVSKKALMISAVIWGVSLVLYAYDFRVGASFLLFLSLLHVFLEFPLNFHAAAIVLNRK